MREKKPAKKFITTKPVSRLTKKELQAELDRTENAYYKNVKLLGALYSKQNHVKTPKLKKKLEDRMRYHSRRQTIIRQRNNEIYNRIIAMRSKEGFVVNRKKWEQHIQKTSV